MRAEIVSVYEHNAGSRPVFRERAATYAAMVVQFPLRLRGRCSLSVAPAAVLEALPTISGPDRTGPECKKEGALRSLI